MTAKEKIREKLLEGKSDKNFDFSNLCTFLQQVGFKLRVGRGSHRVFHKDGVAEIINLQPTQDGKAKPYQVRLVRAIVLKYHL